MKKDIDISIILVARNNWTQIHKCLNSILRQPGLNTEIILLNDGSDDGASTPIKQFADSYDCINLFEQKYKGLASSRNKATRQILGKYTFFINQEEEMLPYSLQIAFRDAMKQKADILQMPYIVNEGNNRNRLVRMPVCKEMTNGTEYIRKFAGQTEICTRNYANLINSEYLKEKIMRFDYRLSEDCDFDFYAKAITGASIIATTQTPICMVPKHDIPDITADNETVRNFNQEQEYIRKNFNEYAESNYFSEEQNRLLRYLRYTNILKYGITRLKKAMTEEDFNKWAGYTRKYIIEYGGWRKLKRLNTYWKLNKIADKTPEKGKDR